MPRKSTIRILYPEDYDETTDEECEEILMSICVTAAKQAGISPEGAKSILDSAGFMPMAIRASWRRSRSLLTQSGKNVCRKGRLTA